MKTEKPKPHKTYSEKLKDPRWQKRRLEIFESAGFTCCRCYDRSQELHVHHINYDKGRDPWDYPDSSLACLCKPCHDSVEDAIRGFRESVIRTPNSALFTSIVQFMEIRDDPSHPDRGVMLTALALMHNVAHVAGIMIAPHSAGVEMPACCALSHLGQLVDAARIREYERSVAE